MKAAVWSNENTRFNISDVPYKPAGKGEVVVKIVAASINHIDVWLKRGAFVAISHAFVGGADGAGTIVEVGDGVDQNLIGKDVVISPGLGWGNKDFQDSSFHILGIGNNGTFAEYTTILLDSVQPKPSFYSFEEAACLPMAATTAYRALISRGALSARDRLLITGIGGAVAQFAFQIASVIGAKVYVTSSSVDKIKQANLAGASGGVTYTSESWVQELREMSNGFDVILDSAGGRSLNQLAGLANVGGRIISIGGTSGMEATLDVQVIFSRQLSILGSLMGSPDDFKKMLEFFMTHKIRPTVDEVIYLEQINEGVQKLQQGKKNGKVVVRI